MVLSDGKTSMALWHLPLIVTPIRAAHAFPAAAADPIACLLPRADYMICDLLSCKLHDL